MTASDAKQDEPEAEFAGRDPDEAGADDLGESVSDLPRSAKQAYTELRREILLGDLKPRTVL